MPIVPIRAKRHVSMSRRAWKRLWNVSEFVSFPYFLCDKREFQKTSHDRDIYQRREKKRKRNKERARANDEREITDIFLNLLSSFFLFSSTFQPSFLFLFGDEMEHRRGISKNLLSFSRIRNYFFSSFWKASEWLHRSSILFSPLLELYSFLFLSHRFNRRYKAVSTNILSTRASFDYQK